VEIASVQTVVHSDERSTLCEAHALFKGILLPPLRAAFTLFTSQGCWLSLDRHLTESIRALHSLVLQQQQECKHMSSMCTAMDSNHPRLQALHPLRSCTTCQCCWLALDRHIAGSISALRNWVLQRQQQTPPATATGGAFEDLPH